MHADLGRYRVLEVLGAGGMADVHLALSVGSFDAKKLVVLKRPRVGRETVDMFLDEARLAMRLNHPNVVQTYDVGVQDGALFLAMEYLEGQPLHHLARKMAEHGEHLHHAELARIASDALSGLHYAHGLADFDGAPLRIVHRDVSPHNLFVTYEGRVVVVDFGIAKATMNQAKTEAGSVKGKLAYMAPEQASAQPVDARADVYAMGVILWELVARRRLHTGGHSGEVLQSVLSAPIPRLSAEVPGVDPLLDEAVQRALERDPARRWESAGAMRDALEEYVARSGHVVRAGDRAAFVSRLFEEERAERARAIQAHVRGAGGAPDVARSAPDLGSATLSTNVIAPAPASPVPAQVLAPVLAPAAAAPRRPILLAGAAVAAVALAAFLGSRASRGPAALPAPSASPSAVAPGLACATNRECSAALGAPAVCRTRDRRCGRLLSPECTRVVGDAADDEAIVFGSVFTTTGTNGPSGQVRQNAAELALQEIKLSVEGIRPGPDARARPLALVVCDDQKDSVAPATHLVDEVGVPAILGIAASTRVMEVATRVTIPKGVLLLSTVATSPTLTSLPDAGLVWRTSPSDVLQAIALVDQIRAAEARYRAENHVPAATSLRIAFAYIKDSYGLGLYEAMTLGAELNGKPLGDRANSGLSSAISYLPNPPRLDAEVETIVSQSTPPAIVVALGSTELVTMFIGPLEKRWPARIPRPRYVLSDAARKPELLELTRTVDSLRPRVRGTTPAADARSKNFQSFVFKYEGMFGAPAPAVFGMAGSYDAVFLLAYAAAAAGPRPLTGGELASGLRRLVAGPRVDVGGAGLNAGFSALAASPAGTFDFDGASGPLDFDRATGEARSNIEVWCIGTNAAREPAFVPSGRLFDAARNEMTSEDACPSRP